MDLPELKEIARERVASWKTVRERGAIVCLFILAALGIVWKWGKLNSLLLLDPAWWLNEYARYARGELPYRDFYWPYGPLSADIFAWPMRWFGVRFAVAQIVVDLLSLIVVFQVYKIAQRLLPRPLPELTAIWFIAVGITARTFFSLFSLISYTPAVHVGAAGLLLTLWAIVAYLDDGRPRIAWIALGTWIACLSKHESALAVFLVVALLFLFDPSRRFKLRHLLLGFGVPAVAYAGWVKAVGWTKFAACLQGFGLAGMTCPWWPTGYGITGALVELGEAWIVLAAASLFVPAWRSRIASRYPLVWIAAACAAAGAVTFEWRLISDLLFGHNKVTDRLQSDLAELLSTSAILRPVLWVCYITAAVIIISLLRNKFAIRAERLKLLMIVSIPCVMGLRSLFGSMLGNNTLEVPAASYPFLLLTGPYLLYLMLTKTPDHSSEIRAIAFCAAIMIGYSIIRIAGGYPIMLSGAPFGVMHTPAGTIRVANRATEEHILNYILANTKPSDTILELPFGGGMSFATGRREPTYSTLFIQLRPPKTIQQEDLARLAAHPPAIVIAPAEAHLGTLYGYPGTPGCVFPRLVWQPDVATSDPDYVLPIVDYIQRNYRIDRTIGPWNLLRPAGGL